MDVTVSRSRVAGTVRAPPSKSYTHRAILAAGYGAGETLVRSPLRSADTKRTMAAVESFGGSVEDGENDTLSITGFGGRPETPDDVLDCGNSGTTTRLVTAAGALCDDLAVLTGDASLRSRPHGPLLAAVESLSGRAESTRRNGRAPLVVGERMTGGRTKMPGNVSSQFVTALLMAGAVTEEGIEVELTTELKSAPYVDVTREVLDDFGVTASETAAGYAADGEQSYVADAYDVPGDFSSISYLLAASAVAGADGGVVVEGARESAQGDTAIVDVVERMGGSVHWDREVGELHTDRADLTGIEVSVADTPDLLPTIAVLGAVAEGETRIVDAEHVRYKETDRVSAMAEELTSMGAKVTEEPDTLTIHGDETSLHGAQVDGRGDHRIVMALAVAALATEGETTIAGGEHVDVSFPDFFATLVGLGADVSA